MPSIPSDVSQIHSLDDLTARWPVKTEEYSAIAEFIYRSFFAGTQSFSTLDRQCLFTETSSLNYLINCVHYHLVLQRSAIEKRHFDFGKVSQIYNFKSIQARTTDTKTSQIYDLIWTRIKAFMKDVRVNSYRKFNILYPWSWGNKNKSWCYNVSKNFQYDYIYKKSDRLKNLDYILKRSQQRVDRKDLLELETITEHLNKFLHVVREEYQLDLTDQHLKEIHTLLYKRIVLNRMLIIEMTKYFKKSSRVYLGSSAKPISKVLSFACQNAGGKSTSFSHGNEIGLHVDFEFERPTSEFGCYNEFVFSSTLTTKKYAGLVNRKNFVTYADPELICSDQPTYRRLMHELTVHVASSISKSKKNIMLIGFPMAPHRYWHYQNAFFYDALKLEIEICSTLTAAGYNVIYKAHPDRLGFVENILKKYVHRVVTEKFEDVVHTVDQVIFHYTHTSTFGYALCTDKPILLCSSELEKIDPEDLTRLESRIQILKYPCAGKAGDHIAGLIDAVKHPMTNFSHSKILELLE